MTTTLLGLTGRAGSGKDTAADYLVRHYGFIRASFAQPLKSMLERMLDDANVDYAYLYEPHLKNEPIPGLCGVSARRMMQTLGTEWGRALHPAWWVFLLERQLGLPDSPVHDRIVITDCRFPNEADWLHQHRGKLVRLHRDAASPVAAHESEAHIDDLFTYCDIVNNGDDIRGLHRVLSGLMADLRVEPREPIREHEIW